MKYFICSHIGLGFFLVERLLKDKEVTQVYFHCQDQKQKDLGMNMEKTMKGLTVVSDMFEPLNKEKKEDLRIIIDDVWGGGMAVFLRGMGYTVIGGSELTDKLENDRFFANQLMQNVMDVPKATKFKDFQSAKKFALSHSDTRYVFKPNDCDVPKQYTYVAKSAQDLVDFLDDVEPNWEWTTEFELQEVVDGIEVDVSRWWNGKDYMPDMMMYFENKKTWSGELGVAGGGEVAIQFPMDPIKPFADIFDKLKPFLKKSGYVGQMSINTIVEEKSKKPYFLESTSRFGYPSLPMDVRLIEEKGTLHQFFTALVKQQDKSFYPKGKVAGVVVLSVPPYPHNSESCTSKGLPIRYDKSIHDDMFVYSPKRGAEDGASDPIKLSTKDGYIGNLVSVGTSIPKVVKDTYEKVKKLDVRGLQYRTDLGESAMERVKRLQSIGLLK